MFWILIFFPILFLTFVTSILKVCSQVQREYQVPQGIRTLSCTSQNERYKVSHVLYIPVDNVLLFAVNIVCLDCYPLMLEIFDIIVLFHFLETLIGKTLYIKNNYNTFWNSTFTNSEVWNAVITFFLNYLVKLIFMAINSKYLLFVPNSTTLLNYFFQIISLY